VIQISKFIADAVIHRRLNFQRLVQTGGMPSSHSGSVATLSTATGLSAGFSSIEFQVATFFSIIVVYDAAGLRRAAGKQAQALNRLTDRMQREHRIWIRGERPLAELLGHTPFEVVVGIAFGIFFAEFWYVFV
jgi:acid phosphatase family membrane protein YuiD